MRNRERRLRSLSVVGSAAVFAIASVLVAASVYSSERESAIRAASSSADLDARYVAAVAAISERDADVIERRCQRDAALVFAVRLEDRARAAMGSAADFATAELIAPLGARLDFEDGRQDALAALESVSLLEADRAAASQYEGVTDVESTCLERAPIAEMEVVPNPSLADVEAIEAEAAAPVVADVPDVSRLDALEQAISSSAPVAVAAGQSLVSVSGLESTQAVVELALSSMSTDASASATTALFEALGLHSVAALSLEQSTAAPASLAPSQPTQTSAPAPSSPEPTESPEPTGSPEPSQVPGPEPVPSVPAVPEPTVP